MTLTQTFDNGLPPASTTKNILLAIGMVLFLALSFKLAGDLTGETTKASISQTDAVVSTLRTPAPVASNTSE